VSGAFEPAVLVVDSVVDLVVDFWPGTNVSFSYESLQPAEHQQLLFFLINP